MKTKRVKGAEKPRMKKITKVSLKSIYGGPEEGSASKIIVEDEDEI